MPRITPEEEMWFDYPDDPLGGRALIRHLKDGEFQDIIDSAMRTRVTFKADDSKETDIFEDTAYRREALAVAVVKDWENFFSDQVDKDHPDGLLLECNKANKKAYSREDGFMRWIYDCRKKLAKIVSDKQEAARKN